MVRLGLYVVLLFAACAAGQSAPSLPGTFGSGEPLPPPVAPEPGATTTAPTTTTPTAIAPATTPPPIAPGAPATADLAAPDPGADADFRDAKGRFDAGDREGARTALEAFEAHHPQSSARPAVELMLARLALLRGDPAAAKTLLDPLVANPPDPGTGSGARYYLGLAETRLGHFAEGRQLLLPYLPPAGASAPGDEALVELRGALAAGQVADLLRLTHRQTDEDPGVSAPGVPQPQFRIEDHQHRPSLPCHSDAKSASDADTATTTPTTGCAAKRPQVTCSALQHGKARAGGMRVTVPACAASFVRRARLSWGQRRSRPPAPSQGSARAGPGDEDKGY